MSDPVTMAVISMGIAAASAGVGAASAAGAAEAQTEVNEIAKENAMEARDANYDQLNLMAQQDTAAAEQQIQQNAIEGLRATATAETAAGESGITGLSVQALLNDMYGKQARFEDNVNQNLENRAAQIDVERQNVSNGYKATVNSLPVVDKVNYLGYALKAGDGIFGAYKDHLKVQ